MNYTKCNEKFNQIKQLYHEKGRKLRFETVNDYLNFVDKQKDYQLREHNWEDVDKAFDKIIESCKNLTTKPTIQESNFGEFKKLLPDYLKKTGIPERYFSSKISDYSEEIQVKVKTALNNKRGLFLFGTVGTGKTHLAGAIIKQLAKNKLEFCNKNNTRFNWKLADVPFFKEVPELHLDIRNNFTIDSGLNYKRKEESSIEKNDLDMLFETFGYTTESQKPTEQDIINAYSSTNVLILDDLGVEKQSEYKHETLYLILNSRWNDNKMTIITSNYNPDELSRRIGDRLVSRIMGMCDVVALTGKDRRLG